MQIEHQLNDWVCAQFAMWAGQRFLTSQLYPQYERLNADRPDVAIFVLLPGQPVRLLDKAVLQSNVDSASHAAFLAQRIKQYRLFLDRVQQHAGGVLNAVIPVSVNDTFTLELEYPVFTFQKPKGSSLVLLPDVDFLFQHFYAAYEEDHLPYEHKRIAAVFVGSTTGDRHTPESVVQLRSERLRLAVRFKGHPDISFHLPTIAQCADDAAHQAILDLGVAGQHLSWVQQYANRFLLSVDGNGATCSRVALALRSQCALVKFASPHELFYFNGLRPWSEYIPVEHPDHVEQIIATEKMQPGYFEHVAHQGRDFYQRYLCETSLLTYTAMLIKRFQSLFDSKQTQVS